MASYELSGLASYDLVGIYKFGKHFFGERQAKNYSISLEIFISELANRKELARDAGKFAYNLKYCQFNAHVIFYFFDSENKIFVLRILGKRMNFIDHL